MPRRKSYILGTAVFVWLATLNVGLGGARMAQGAALDVNDLSYLWPAPVDAKDVAGLISADLSIIGGTRKVWPDEVFRLLLQTAQETVVEGPVPAASSQISFESFKSEFETPSTWKLVSFRFDSSAPGGHAGFVSRFGSTPQLRMVFQPVTFVSSAVKVHDVTAHIAYSFTKPSSSPFPAVPDKDTVRKVLDELKALKAASESVGAPTGGLLRVHPGLQARVPGFTTKVVTFLQRTAALGQLTDLAFMGIKPPEPWIFFAMRKRLSDGAFERVGPKALAGRSAQMLKGGPSPFVFPEPITSNQPPDRGVSTARLFARTAQDELLTPVISGDSRPLLQDIPDIIANPEISNVFNTDCVSCHTESTRRHALKIVEGDRKYRYSLPNAISAVDPVHLPTAAWNVRNFGWFQQRNGMILPTISQRTANEAAEAADFANREYFSTAQIAAASAAIPDIQTARSAVTMTKPVANPLTLVMTIKSPKDFQALKTKIEHMQSLPPDKNPIVLALNKLGTVHFARFVFLNERQLAVITTYDGSFEDYIDAFVNDIGGVFDSILEHVADAPPTPVKNPENRKPFLEFVRKNDLTAVPPFYSAYPDLTVLDILMLRKKGGS